jgi:disulfide bond formation protein DsbB
MRNIIRPLLLLNNFHRLILIISVMIFMVLFVFEYIFSYKPCVLCIYQRFAYIIMSYIALANIQERHLSLSCFVLYVISIISNSLITMYHVLIERHIIVPTSQCSRNILPTLYTENMSSAEFITLLETASPSRCDVPTILFSGLSMSECHLLFSILLLSYLCVYYFVLHPKKICQ